MTAITSPLNLVKLETCPACQSKRHRHLFDLDYFGVFECECSHRFIDPSLDARSMMEIYRSSAALSEINPACGHYYEYETLHPKSLTYRDYSRALGEAGTLAPGKGLLEVGCGAGAFLKFAREKGWRVHGVDAGGENIQKVAQEGMDGTCCDYLEYQTSNKPDCIVLWDLIEHPQDPGLFVQKSYELLNSSGLLLIAAPHYPNLLSILADGLYQFSGARMKDPLKRLYMLEHTSYFSEKTLRRLLEKNHFKMERVWKTETDLKRYSFSALLRFALSISFWVARIGGWQNRVIAIARKV